MHDTKIGIVILSDLPVWQKLNVAAFLATGMAAVAPESIGEAYEDGSGNSYLPLVGQPILIYEASPEHLLRTNSRALSRGVRTAIYSRGMFKTMNDDDNRAVVRVLAHDELDLAGLALRADRKTFDKIVNGLKLHA
jgi:hypothetical protein